MLAEINQRLLTDLCSAFSLQDPVYQLFRHNTGTAPPTLSSPTWAAVTATWPQSIRSVSEAEQTAKFSAKTSHFWWPHDHRNPSVRNARVVNLHDIVPECAMFVCNSELRPKTCHTHIEMLHIRRPLPSFGLGGGAWDHRRCGTFFLPNALHFPRATQAIAPSVHRPGATQATAISAVCQPAKLAKRSPAAPRRHSGRGRPFLQLQQVPEALAVSFWGRSRLPFASPQNSPNAPLQLPGATQAAADLSCSSNKSRRPWQCPFKDVQGCRLPARKTRQMLPCSSQAPPRPRQTFPAAPTSPGGPGSVLLRTFKAAVCQPAKLAKCFPAAPRRHSGRGRPFLQLLLQLQQVPEALAVSF